MQSKLSLLIAAGSFAALAASGSALAQSSSIPNQPSDAKSTLKNDGSSGDKAANPKQKADSKMQGQSSNNPISVTPPSADNNQTTSAGVNTPPAKANASAGPTGVSADAKVQGDAGSTGTTGTTPPKPEDVAKSAKSRLGKDRTESTSDQN